MMLPCLTHHRSRYCVAHDNSTDRISALNDYFVSVYLIRYIISCRQYNDAAIVPPSVVAPDQRTVWSCGG